MITDRKQFFILLIALMGILGIVDRVTKMVSAEYFLEPYVLFPNMLEFSFFGNPQFLFYLEPPIWIVSAITSSVLVFLIFQWFDAYKKKEYTLALFFGMIFVGALSNFYDRLFLGYVIDFIRVPSWSVWNFADMYIIGGVIAILFFLWHTDSIEKKQKKDDRE